MARVPYLDAADLSEENRDLLARPINLYRAFANAPGALRVFAAVGKYLRYGSKTDARLREMATLQVGYLARSPYEWSHHIKYALEFGCTEADIQAVIDETEGRQTHLDELTRLVLSLARAITAKGAAPAEDVEELMRRVDRESAVELLFTIAQYNCVVRLLAALAVDVELSYQHYLERFPITPAA